MLEMQGVEHVVVSDLQMRLFQRAGIAASRCGNLEIERCRFLNKEIAHVGYTKGTGILLKEAPGTRIERCVFTRLLYGVQATDSPYLTLTHCTSFKNLFSSAVLRRSARGSRVTYNSFTFTGNTSFSLVEDDASALASLVCDNNNYATTIRAIGETAARAYAEAGAKIPSRIDNPVQPPARYGVLSGSKRMIDLVPPGGDNRKRERFFGIADWQKFSSKDGASIFADPQYADPLNGDFRVLPDSPNIVKEAVIGAGLVKE